jgi:sugar (pentulose or hexulose) kinase
MNLSLALDLGTTSITAIAVDEAGRIVTQITRENDAAVAGLAAGRAEQDPRCIFTLALEALRELADNMTGSPLCLGLTGQMHGTLLVDSERNPLTNLITWQDRRANEIVLGTETTHLECLLSRCSVLALDPTGCRLSPGYMGVTLSVLQSQDELPAAAHRASLLADWIGAELCDEPIVTDRSNAASSGIYDLQSDCWSTELLAACDLSGDLFPTVRESGVVIGRLTPEVAAETGLPSGLPVCNAIGDNQAAVLGSVPSHEPAIQINIGTGGQISWPAPDFTRVADMDTRYLPHDRFMLVGAGLAGGDAFAWVNRTATSWLKSLGLDVPTEQIYEAMTTQAADLSAHNDDLTCNPLFRGTRRQPLARGEFSGVSLDNFTLGHVSRAVLQGIAAGMKWFYDNAGDQQPQSIQRIIGSGNGLRKNPLLVEIIEREFERPVLLPSHEEAAAYGTALLAGSTVGMWADLETAGKCIRLVSGGH